MPTLEGDEDLSSMPLPATIDPYATLSLPPTATPAEIRKAYRRLALQHHPDKAGPATDRATATATFQRIALAYAVLSSPARRARYDATGRTEECIHSDGDGDGGGFSWSDFYRAQFADVVSVANLEAFKAEYQGSGEERSAVLRAYVDGRGDMDRVFESVMCSEVGADEGRFRGWIEEAIEAGEVDAYEGFVGETAASKRRRRKRAREEAEEAEVEAERLGLKDKLKDEAGEDGLRALIQQRQKGRQQGFLEALEAKYAPPPKTAKGKKKGGKAKREVVDEPPEEMFEKNRKKKRTKT